VLKINGGYANVDTKVLSFYSVVSGSTPQFHVEQTSYNPYEQDIYPMQIYVWFDGILNGVVANSLRFYDNDLDITADILYVVDGDIVLILNQWRDDVTKITAAVYVPGDNTGSGTDFVVDFQKSQVKISRNDVEPTQDVVTLSFQYFVVQSPALLGNYSVVKWNYMLDGASSSAAIWGWTEDPETEYSDAPYGAVLFTAAWSAARNIQGIRITAGGFDIQQYSALNDKKVLPCSFTLSVLYSADVMFSASLDDPSSPNTSLSWLTATATTIYCKDAKNISVLLSAGYVWIDFEQVSYTSVTLYGGGRLRFNGCTRGYGGSVASIHAIFLSASGNRNVRSDVTFTELCKELTGVAFNSGQTVDVDTAAFGLDRMASAIMVVVNSAEPLKFTNRYTPWVDVGMGSVVTEEVTVYGVSLQDFRIESDRVIMSDIRLAAADSATTVLDSLGVRIQYGERLYKQSLLTSGVLLTQTQLNGYAKAMLAELYKNHAKAELVEMCNPSWKQGMTLNITNTPDGINRNYLVERLQNNDGKLTLNMSYYP
jgi:hypothetical protein